MRVLRVIWAVNWRNLELIRRQRNLIVQTAIVPVAVLLLSAVLLGAGGDQWPIGLVNNSDSPHADEVVRSIRDSRSNITPYFDVIVTDPRKAKSMVESGKLHMLVSIPSAFARTNEIEISTFNINSDTTKNFRLRLEYALDRVTNGGTTIGAKLVTEKPHDVWRSAFYGGSCVLLAMFLGATLMAANLFVFERESRTSKEILLTPVGPWMAGAGILVSAVLVAMLASLLPLAVGWLLFPFHVSPLRIALVYALMVPVLVGCAGLGILLGHLLGTYRVVQPAVVLGSVATFFAGGGFAGVSFLSPAAQTFAYIWPFSRIFEWFNPLLQGFSSGFSAGQYLGIFAAASVGIALLVFSYRREQKRPASGGQ